MTTTTDTERPTFTVDPARLDPGTWCHTTDKTLGLGDIAKSYSADRIGMDYKIRKPFLWRGTIWLCTSMAHCDGKSSAEAYRLVHPEEFTRKITTYSEMVKKRDGEYARRDPYGFHDGMSVKFNESRMVLCGPPATFVQGVCEQMDLFG